MKRILIPIAAGALFLASCTDAPKADKAEACDAQTVAAATGATYKADLAQSSVSWTGTKPTGQHTGAFKLSEGSVNAEAGNITGGKFVIDLKSITITDKDTNGASKLAGHLLSPDFFHADSIATASFEITGVKAGVDTAGGKEILMKDATHTVSGNLTLKGVTKGITFPARVAMTDASITTDANFNIDRSQWNMAYGSDKGLGDKFIRPDVNIVLHVVANK